MSLLTRKAPHTAYVQQRTMTRNPEGIRVPVNIGDPIPVRGMAEPVRDWAQAEEHTTYGLQIIELVIWRSKEWPGDVHSLVRIEDNWYEPNGPVQHHFVSRRTSHYRITLKWLKGA
ncbi:hypothetical protein [Microbacterium sp. No. 7]|uniref:hypothetical protein n=1 Tax=Microbacterium sp. No. 7 TaxID=1714373 RepID=UPI0006ECFB0A|nr:hypothetical protein [Microbacterium sp. No. 7]ALJ22045.1 hypothetical protein AOA12_19975 [Microbacterium sp. No. 7]